MKIQYLGHSCFRMESGGYEVIVDPYEKGSVPGLRDLDVEADLCLCSHEHGDHNARDCVRLREGGENPFSIEALPSWHDDSQGTLRGSNLIHILSAEGFRVAHLGDLGCMPEEEQIEKLRGADVVLAPAGGYYTAPPQVIADLIGRIGPGILIPMHYRTEKSGFSVLGTYEELVNDCGGRIQILDTDTLSLPAAALDAAGAEGSAPNGGLQIFLLRQTMAQP